MTSFTGPLLTCLKPRGGWRRRNASVLRSLSGLTPTSRACGLYDRMLALYTRDVVPEGIDLNFIAIDEPRQIFDRMVTHHAYDASEMSASEHVAMVAAGNSPFIGIPAFPSRVFRHSFIFI